MTKPNCILVNFFVLRRNKFCELLNVFCGKNQIFHIYFSVYLISLKCDFFGFVYIIYLSVLKYIFPLLFINYFNNELYYCISSVCFVLYNDILIIYFDMLHLLPLLFKLINLKELVVFQEMMILF